MREKRGHWQDGCAPSLMPMSGYGKLGGALCRANLADLRRAQALERGRAFVRIGRRHSRIVGDGRRHVELRF